MSTASTSDLEALLARVEAAKGPDRELDVRIVAALLATPSAHVEQSPINDRWCIYDGVDSRGHKLLWECGPKHRRLGWCGRWEITASLDACKALQEQVLPGWAWRVGTCSVSDDAWTVPDFNCPKHGARLLEQFGPVENGSIWDDGIDIDSRPSGNVPLAWLAAILTALIAQSKEQVDA